MFVLSSFVSGTQKCHLMLRTNIRNAKKYVLKSDVINFTRFMGNCTTRNKDIVWIFCMGAAGMYLNHMYSSFLDNLEL